MSGISDSSKFNSNASYYSPNGSVGPGGGVTSLNTLTGAVSIASSPSVNVFTAVGGPITLSTAGLAQAPLSVTTAGTVSAGEFVGTGLGLTLPTIPAGTSCQPAQISTQTINFVIGNYRIQGGFNGSGPPSTVTITWATPFTGACHLYAQSTNNLSPSGIASNGATSGTFNTLLPNTNFYWLAIGPT